ncbi:MAG: PadR family transcriptional regulator [Oscillibacter sp.]|nr:PadR family transcriptional regulator [Oscillibacter sp.]
MVKKDVGSVSMLVLALLKEKEMYGYQIIEELDRRSSHVFQMKEGTLYPVLHGLEKDKLVSAREAVTERGRTRRYYAITEKGLRALEEKKAEWNAFSSAVTAILAGA